MRHWNDWDAELFEFTPEEIELLAEMEHERWDEERKLEGWAYAPVPGISRKRQARTSSPIINCQMT